MRLAAPSFCVALLLFAQDSTERIGKVEFFGSTGLDVSSTRKSLPVNEGDRFPTSDEEMLALINRIREAVGQSVGRPTTDVAPVCCDERGAWMIYVGLPGTFVQDILYDPRPVGAVLLPAQIVKAYDEAMDAILGAVRRGAGEDHSKGYALSTDPTLRDKQMTLREGGPSGAPEPVLGPRIIP